MKIKICALNVAAFTYVSLMMFRPAMAGEVLFQPRLETGKMYYAFESEAMNNTNVSKPVHGQLGSNFTQEAFDYEGYMPFIGGGATFFVSNFFLDLCGQYAWDGHDTAPIKYSGYSSDPNGFLSVNTNDTASFDRSDAAVSVGYAFTRQFSLFAGYKWARTTFDTTLEGRLSIILYKTDDEDYYASGRYRGEADYRFEYEGPFLGVIHSWDCSHCRLLKGIFTVNLALARLSGSVVSANRDQLFTITSINGQSVPEDTVQVKNPISARLDTKGDAGGLTFGVCWRGTTALEGLTYALGISGYRYESHDNGALISV